MIWQYMHKCKAIGNNKFEKKLGRFRNVISEVSSFVGNPASILSVQFISLFFIFMTEAISRTDEGEPRPKYIFNKMWN